ncbi:MAG: hypothetical protein Q4P33_04505 [Flaviflexus sp.]|nr:hypothetical protein [Flaviflexus sp.]
MSDTSDLAAEQPNTAGDSLIAVLDELIDNVTEARGMPMSASAMINRSEVLDLLGTARDIVPDQIHAADSIISEASEVRAQASRKARQVLEGARDEAERIVAEGKQEAEQIVSRAKAHAEHLVSEHEITEQARGRASDIVAEAQAQAYKLNAGANRYTDEALASLQTELESLLGQVRAGREEVARRSREAQANAPGPQDSAAPDIGPDEDYEDPYLQRSRVDESRSRDDQQYREEQLPEALGDDEELILPEEHDGGFAAPDQHKG